MNDGRCSGKGRSGYAMTSFGKFVLQITTQYAAQLLMLQSRDQLFKMGWLTQGYCKI